MRQIPGSNPGGAWRRGNCARLLALGLLMLGVSACGDGDSAPLDPMGPLPQAQVQQAVDQLDPLAADMMRRTVIPGMAVAVVQGDQVIYAKGFGVRAVGSPQAVDADTVFQLASVSKPIGATVVAQQVGAARIKWDTPIRQQLPWFSLSDPYVSQNVTIGDMYAHRSGLPEHAGDLLEELGFTREESKPLGMNSTSSRFADFRARPNRAVGHVKENGVFVVGPERGSAPGQQR